MKSEQKEKIKKENQRKKIIDTVLISVAILVLSIAFIFIQEFVLAIFTILVGIVGILLNLKFSYREEILVEADNFDLISEESRKKASKELANLENNGVKKIVTEKRLPELKIMIENAEREKNTYILEEHKLQIEDESLNDNLTNLSEVEEELILRKEKLDKVVEKEETIQLAISKLKEAYTELKDEVIPDIEKDIKYTISRTTNGKYSNVKYNDYNGLVTENEWGQIVTVDKLSAGTIDQMYLGFRLAIADKYHKVPIIFDEAFVFCDDTRLENILKTLSEMSEDRQIIILSCSGREKQILEALNVNFNCVKME